MSIRFFFGFVVRGVVGCGEEGGMFVGKSLVERGCRTGFGEKWLMKEELRRGVNVGLML